MLVKKVHAPCCPTQTNFNCASLLRYLRVLKKNGESKQFFPAAPVKTLKYTIESFTSNAFPVDYATTGSPNMER